MEQTTYNTQRQELLRRAAAGENVDKLIDKLEADHAADLRAQQRGGEVERARQQIAREEARAALQQQYDQAAASFNEAADRANDLAAIAEKAFADAVAAFDAWRAAIEAARPIGSQAHHLQMQGATPIKMPVLPGTGELSVHLMRHAGVQFHQQILYTGKLPRAS